jgi:hypothetical protein
MASFVTSELRIPPSAGAGMAVDLAILLAGIAIAALRALETGSERAEATVEPESR